MPKTKKQKTRVQQFSNGDLVDVSHYAKRHGIKYPVAVTKCVWYGYINPPEFLGSTLKENRILSMFRRLRVAMCNKDENNSENLNQVKFDVISECGLFTTKTCFIAECEPDDSGSPCITISDDWSI